MTQDKKDKPWSRKYSCCIECQRTDRPHECHGLCRCCYDYHRHQIPIKLTPEQVARKNAKRSKTKQQKYFGGNYEATIQRDNYHCTICGTSEKLVVHHIDCSGKNDNPNNDLGNLQTLCTSCHTRVHKPGKIDRWAKKYDCCKTCGTTTRHHAGYGLCIVCYNIAMNPDVPRAKPQKPRRPMETWTKSNKYVCCQGCGTTETKHYGKGLCKSCYFKPKK